MKVNKYDTQNRENDVLLSEKTNQDYNKQSPNLNDPNQEKNGEIGDSREEIKRKEIKSENYKKTSNSLVEHIREYEENEHEEELDYEAKKKEKQFKKQSKKQVFK